MYWIYFKCRALAESFVKKPLRFERHLRVEKLHASTQPLANYVKRNYVLENNFVKQTRSPICNIISAYAFYIHNPLIITLV